MIFYFTGTGNSGFIAEETAKILDDKILCISDLIKDEEDLKFTLKDGEDVGFVFPVYAWAPPKMVLEFIRKAEFTNFKDNYVYAITDCGGSAGNTMKIMKKELEDNHLQLDSGFSIIMPNNYIIMGNVDSKEEAEKKIAMSRLKVAEICDIIKKKTRNVFDVKKGVLGSIMSSLLHPVFDEKAIDTSKFYVEDKCTGCKSCEKVCTSGTIKIENKKPVWGKECNQCLACVHSCPVHAIQYGKSTKEKGRYLNPYFHKSKE